MERQTFCTSVGLCGENPQSAPQSWTYQDGSSREWTESEVTLGTESVPELRLREAWATA